MPTTYYPGRDLAASYLRDAQQGDDAALAALAALASEVLAMIGDTPDRIAEALTGERICGLPRCSEENPLARFLAHTLGADGASVAVAGCFLRFTLADGDELTVEDIALPATAAAFLRQFDDGRFEQLVDRRTRRPVKHVYRRSEAQDMQGLDTNVRGPLVEVTDRCTYLPGQPDSDPVPDHLVAAITAAGLTAEDRAGVLRLYDGDLSVAVIWGHDDQYWDCGAATPLHNSAQWNACASVAYCTAPSPAHQRAITRDEALQYVLTHLGETCTGRAPYGDDDE